MDCTRVLPLPPNLIEAKISYPSGKKICRTVEYSLFISICGAFSKRETIVCHNKYGTYIRKFLFLLSLATIFFDSGVTFEGCKNYVQHQKNRDISD